jgi:hypothetical protein
MSFEAWNERGEREGVEHHAAELFGCSQLGADNRDSLWHIIGCGDGLFVEVTRTKDGEVRDSTHFFFDVASEDPAQAVKQMQQRAPEGDWWVQGYPAPDVMKTLSRLAAVDTEGAKQLDCRRAAISYHFVKVKELTFTVVEGCGRKATFFGDDPPRWHLMTDVPI